MAVGISGANRLATTPPCLIIAPSRDSWFAVCPVTGLQSRSIMSDISIRADGRTAGQLRPLRFQNHIAPHAAGSTLIEWGNTRVICGVTIEESVPRWMKEQGVTGGWITAE